MRPWVPQGDNALRVCATRTERAGHGATSTENDATPPALGATGPENTGPGCRKDTRCAPGCHKARMRWLWGPRGQKCGGPGGRKAITRGYGPGNLLEAGRLQAGGWCPCYEAGSMVPEVPVLREGLRCLGCPRYEDGLRWLGDPCYGEGLRWPGDPCYGACLRWLGGSVLRGGSAVAWGSVLRGRSVVAGGIRVMGVGLRCRGVPRAARRRRRAGPCRRPAPSRGR